MGKGRKVSEACCGSSNPAGSRWPGAAPKSAWSTRRTGNRAFPASAFARTRCLQHGALRDHDAHASCRYCRHERTSALRRDLNQLSSDAGAKLLRALGVKGDEAELRSASAEFGGHCLALTLLGSYLTDACQGDIRRRSEVSRHLSDDLRQGAHARKVMESYQSWFGEGPELAILRMLGLFDRPADEQT